MVITRSRTTDPNEVPETAFYITSHPPDEGCAPRFGALARGHWGGCENRNHWVRDHCMHEDKTRSKNYNLNAVLAGLRVCLITIKTICFPDDSWPAIQERCQNNPSLAYSAITKITRK